MAVIWGDPIDGNLSLIIILAIVAMMYGAIFLVVRRWANRESGHEHTMDVLKESRNLSVHLVKHFMPSFKVQKYQFRGMTAKAGTVDIGFEALSLTVGKSKRVLDGVTGGFGAGRICACMGPSGAGKTTFMNVLCGKATYGKMGGTIKINGVKTDISSFKSVTGFVPQDDIVHQDLTVSEQIEFSARLRNHVGTSAETIDAITQDVLNVMQIDHIQNSIVGGVEQRGISGGQRKRVNIGLELSAQPTVLFLDEPTSGLDSTSSLTIIFSLARMCNLGMTSIMVIHQPRYSLFTLFDDVLLLGKGGHTVYLGSSNGAKKYFEARGFEMPADENPADWFMDVIAGEMSNASVPDFKPEMLKQMWIDHKEEAAQKGVDLHASAGREMDHGDDYTILSHKLAEEWEKIDENGDGGLEANELKDLVMNCAQLKQEPSAEVIKDLMERMAGPGATEVSRNDFLTYMCNLHGDIAKDAASHAEGHNVQDGGEKETVTVSVDDPQQSKSFTHKFGHVGKKKDTTNHAAKLDPNTGLKRETPHAFSQYTTLVLRALVQWWRLNPQRGLFVGALVLGAIVLAILDSVVLDLERWSCMALLNLHTALALLMSIFCLQIFGADQPVFWRESASGMSVPAYYLSRISVNTFDLILQTFAFTAVYFLVRQPKVPYWLFFLPFLFTAFAASGWGFLVSTLVPPRHGPFVVSLVVFIICGLLGNPASLEDVLTGGFMEAVVSCLSITRWALQMNFETAYDVLGPNVQDYTNKNAALLQTNIDVFTLREMGSAGFWGTGAIVLLLMGIVLRIGAFLGLRFMHRDKQV